VPSAIRVFKCNFLFVIGVEIYKNFPNETILGIGWFLTAFFLLHFYPVRFIENIIDKFKKNKDEFDWTNKW